MKILRSDLPHCPELHGAVVVIDVLRSFTTIAYAFARGAREVIPVGSVEAARDLRLRCPDALALGAVGGGAPAAGLDMGNSPAQVASLDLAGRQIIQYTAGGTRGQVACDGAVILLAASLVCAPAAARYLRLLAPPSVTLVVTGVDHLDVDRWREPSGGPPRFRGSGSGSFHFRYLGAIQQEKLQPLLKTAVTGIKVDYGKLVIVFLILAFAIVTNWALDFPAAGVWIGIILGAFIRKTPWTR